jgi:hypothetical protein
MIERKLRKEVGCASIFDSDRQEQSRIAVLVLNLFSIHIYIYMYISPPRRDFLALYHSVNAKSL